MHDTADMIRRTAIFIGILWCIALIALLYVYYTRDFTQYMNTVPKETTPVHASGFAVTSPAFGNNESIPAQFTCDEKQISPPLAFAGAPRDTKSFVVIAEDRDVPKSLVASGVFLHWVLFDIPSTKTEIGVGEVAGVQGATGNGIAGYVGPCSPPQYEPREHRYYFDVYALDTLLELEEGASIETVRAKMNAHVLAHSTLIGRYARSEK